MPTPSQLRHHVIAMGNTKLVILKESFAYDCWLYLKKSEGERKVLEIGSTWQTSSGTQRQLVEAGKILDFSAPEFFSRPFTLFPAPSNCPWVSEDAWQRDFEKWTCSAACPKRKFPEPKCQLVSGADQKTKKAVPSHCLFSNREGLGTTL